MTSCSCPICETSEGDILLKFDCFGFPIRTVQCRACGLLYANPRPTRSFLDDFYRTKYLYFYEGVKKLSDIHLAKRGHPELAARRLRRYYRFLRPDVRVLDVGSGTGLFLHELKSQVPSAVVVGIEPDPVSANYAANLGLTVHRGFLDSFHDDVQFDIVSAFHVIEHIDDLKGFLDRVSTLLRPGGTLILETPNAAGSWTDIGMFHIAHLQTFSPATLSHLCRMANYRVIETGVLEGKYDSSNFYLVATNRSSGGPIAPLNDQAESEFIAAKCHSIRAVRLERVLRSWGKWLYFRLGGNFS